MGYHYLEKICKYKGVEIHVLNNEREEDVNKALVEDVMALIASFSGKLYGMRSYKNKDDANNKTSRKKLQSLSNNRKTKKPWKKQKSY